MKFQLGQFFSAATFLAVLHVICFSELSAHPPEHHRRAVPAAAAKRPIAVNNVADQADRQLAYFQFEFLTAFANECPTELQPTVIQQALAEFHVATQSPQAIPLESLLTQRASLHDKLRDSHILVHCNWNANGVTLEPVPPIEIAKGLARCIIIEVDNSDSVVANITASVGNKQQNATPWTVLPGKSQFFLLTLDASEPSQRVELKTDSVVHEFSIAVQPVEPARIRGRLVDAETDLATPARVWVEGSDHQYRHAGPFAMNRSFTEKPLLLFTVPRSYRVPFFYADGSFEIDVPPGKTLVTIERGFEHLPKHEMMDLKPGEIHDLTLSTNRFMDLKKKGWISGDTHVHWVTNAWNVDLPIEDLAWVQRAEDLRVANNLTLLHRTHIDAFIKPSQAPVGPIAKFCNDEYHLEMAEEYRNQNLYGHLCFLNLKWLVLPIGTGPQIAGDDSLDYPINKPAIFQAREQGAISIEAHGIGANHELPLNAIHALTDSLDQIDPVDYYRLLDCGFQLPLTNGSDHPARIVGCARAYVKVDGNFSYEKWIDGIRRGRTFTTSGPLLFLTINGQSVGDVLSAKKDEKLTVTVNAHSRYPLGRLQLVSNGEVLKEFSTDETTASIKLELPADRSRWCVARCSRSDQWNAIWQPDIAHTSAIYVHVDSKPVFREDAAREWINRMRLHIRDIQTKGKFGNDSQRKEAIAYADESIRRYEQLIARRTAINTPTRSVSELADELRMLASFVSNVSSNEVASLSLKSATSMGDLRKAAEPFVLFKVDIDDNAKIEFVAGSTLDAIPRDHTQRFLVEVHNKSRNKDRLNIIVKGHGANPAPCEVGLVENLISTSQLSGEEFEWKLIELRWSQPGSYDIEASIGRESLADVSHCTLSFPVKP